MEERTYEDMIVESMQERAERRVRAGESRAEVARSLGIPLSTVSGWAHRGGWRRKDLVTVRDAKLGQLTLDMIAKLTATEREHQHEQAAKMREAMEASQAELESMTAGGGLPGSSSAEGVPAQKLAMAMADSLLRQGRLEEADRAIRLAARFAEAEQTTSAREEAKWREERDSFMKWWAKQQTAYHKLHQVTRIALEQMAASHALEDKRSADNCCPKCSRRMDFWPQEVDRPDDDDDSSVRADDDDSSKRVGDDDDSGTKAGGDDSGWGVGADDDDSWLNRMERGLTEPSG